MTTNWFERNYLTNLAMPLYNSPYQSYEPYRPEAYRLEAYQESYEPYKPEEDLRVFWKDPNYHLDKAREYYQRSNPGALDTLRNYPKNKYDSKPALYYGIRQKVRPTNNLVVIIN